MIELKLPELGENIVAAEVIRLLVGEGDTVQAGQNVVELESEKAAFPLPCPSAGRVGKIHVKVGDSVSVGQTVLTIEEAAPAAAEAKPTPSGDGKPSKPAPSKPDASAKKQAEAPSEPEASAKRQAEAPRKKPPPEQAPADKEPVPTPPKRHVAAGPATRRLARQLGVNLSDVTGSARGGRITRDDVKAFVKERLAAPAAPSQGATPALPDFSRFGSIKRQPLNKIARTAAQRLSLAWRTVPHVTQHDVTDVTELEAARRRFNEQLGKAGPKITMTALAIQASIAALKAYPQFNASFDPASEELIVKDYYHIGIAVDTEHGLLVPVLRDADQKSLLRLAAELSELAEKARQRALTMKDMEGGSFTITNLGGIGGGFFTPIINYPEVAILGLGRAAENAERVLLPLSLSYDHRATNGADGARFIRKLADLLGEPFRLLAEL